METSNKRDIRFDIIKGWAMLTIIVFHCSQGCITSNWGGQFIGNPWNVPIFFIVSGFFLKEESLGNPLVFLKGKFKRLYLPATIIYAIMILMHNVFVKIGWYPIGEFHPSSGAPFSYYGIKETCIGLAKVLAAGGSGELVMGAMWFIYSLLYAFIGMTLLFWLIGLIFKSEQYRFYWMTICCLLLAVVSCILSQNYGITINRFSTALTAMFLIWWGMIVNRKWKWSFDKWWGFIIALIVFVHCVLMQRVNMALARNEFQDIVQLTIGCTAAIYIWGFIAKRIQHTFIGRLLALMGRESLYLMAFHIIGFFICNSLLVKLVFFSIGDKKGLYTYEFGNQPLLLLAYVCLAVSTSFAILYLYRFVKSLVIKVIKK